MSEPKEKLDISDLKDTFLECPVCVEHFNQTDKRPRLLQSCLHAFCTQCLHQLLLQEGKGQITCPLCRQVEKITGKVNTLPVDPVRNKLVDYVQMKHQKKVLCTDCPDGNDAESRCQECSLYLCKDCRYVHKRHRLTSDHSVISLNEVLEQPLKSFTKGHFCSHHPKHHLEFYCDTDESLCCLSCTVLEHHGHHFQKIEEAVKIKKQDLESSLKNVRADINAMKDKHHREGMRKAKIQLNQIQAKAEASKQFTNLERMTRDRKESVLKDIDIRASAFVSSCEKNLSTLEQSLAIIESSDHYYRKAKENSDAVDMLQMYPALKRGLEGSTAGPSQEVELTVDNHLRFEPSYVSTIENILPETGHITEIVEAAAADYMATDAMEIEAFLNDVFTMGMNSKTKEELFAKILSEKQKMGKKVNCSRYQSKTSKPKKIKCQHIFCPSCFNFEFKQSEVCPVCTGKILTGNMPPGEMKVTTINTSFPGYRNCNTLQVHYKIPGGVQNENHPRPGRRYSGMDLKTFLPDVQEGHRLLALLTVAWERKLTFEVEYSTFSDKLKQPFPLNIRIPQIQWNSMDCYVHPMLMTYIEARLAELGVTEDDL